MGATLRGNSEIFLFDTTTGMFTQITDETVGNSTSPRINEDGTRIAFHSTANINGGNTEGNFEIYLFDTTAGMFTQITDETAALSLFPAINADGTLIPFVSNANINGGNPDGNLEIYLFDTTTATTTQITDETAGGLSDGPAINAKGTRIALLSRAVTNEWTHNANIEK